MHRSHEDSARLLAQLLRASLPEPLAIELAYDGAQAVASATGTARPDVVVLDIGMPEMDGFAAASAIKGALGSASPTLIAVSGDLDSVERARAFPAFRHALPKPRSGSLRLR